MKKVLSFFIILCFLLSSFVVNVSADITANGAVETFDYDSSTAVGTSRVYKEEGGTNAAVVGTNVDYTTLKTEYGSSAVFKYQSSTSPTYFPNYSWSASDGYYHISFNLYPYTTDAKRIYKQREGNGSSYYPILAFDTAGKIVYYEHATSLQISEISDDITTNVLGNYEANKWYNVDVYIDTENDKYAVKVDCQDEGGVTTIGKATDVKLTGWGTGLKRMKISQYMPSTAATAGANLMALDNVKVESYTATAANLVTNVADGATDVDVDKEFKIYAEDTITEVTAVLKQNSSEVVGAFATPIISGSTAKLNLTSNLSPNTPYALELTVKSDAFPNPTSTKTINFTTGDGAIRKTAVNMDFEGVTDVETITEKYGVNPFYINNKNNVLGATFDYNDYYKVFDTEGVNGNAIKLLPGRKTGPTYDVKANLPEKITNTKIVIEYDKLDTSTNVKGISKLTEAGTMLYELKASNIAVFSDGDSSTNVVNPRQSRMPYNTINEYKVVINVNSNKTSTTYDLYINGVVVNNGTTYAKDVSLNVVGEVASFIDQTYDGTAITADDYVLYDNIKVSYVEKTPEVTVKVNDNAFVQGETVLASNDVVSVVANDLIYPKAKVIYALYKDGVLVEAPYGDLTTTYTVTVNDIETGNYQLKVMLWKDLDSLVPLAKAVPVK